MFLILGLALMHVWDRGSFAVKFLGEEALDMGGVTKEFFHVVSEHMLDPQANLFTPQGPNNTFHPSPSSSINGTSTGSLFFPFLLLSLSLALPTELHLEYFRFFGRLLGKALIEERLVKAPFTRAIWKLLLGTLAPCTVCLALLSLISFAWGTGKSLTFEDFQTVDKQIYMRLLQVQLPTSDFYLVVGTPTSL